MLDPAIVLQILYHYYQDSQLINELRRQPPGEILVQLETTVRQQLVRSGMAKEVLVAACDRVMAQLTGAIQAHQYRTSFVMLIGAIIQQQIQEEKEK